MLLQLEDHFEDLVKIERRLLLDQNRRADITRITGGHRQVSHDAVLLLGEVSLLPFGREQDGHREHGKRNGATGAVIQRNAMAPRYTCLRGNDHSP